METGHDIVSFVKVVNIERTSLLFFNSSTKFYLGLYLFLTLISPRFLRLCDPVESDSVFSCTVRNRNVSSVLVNIFQDHNSEGHYLSKKKKCKCHDR